MAKSQPYQYGVSPAPSNWAQTVDALKTIKKPAPAKPTGPSLYDRLGTIEALLKKAKS